MYPRSQTIIQLRRGEFSSRQATPSHFEEASDLVWHHQLLVFFKDKFILPYPTQFRIPSCWLSHAESWIVSPDTSFRCSLSLCRVWSTQGGSAPARAMATACPNCVSFAAVAVAVAVVAALTKKWHLQAFLYQATRTPKKAAAVKKSAETSLWASTFDPSTIQ